MRKRFLFNFTLYILPSFLLLFLSASERKTTLKFFSRDDGAGDGRGKRMTEWVLMAN